MASRADSQTTRWSTSSADPDRGRRLRWTNRRRSSPELALIGSGQPDRTPPAARTSGNEVTDQLASFQPLVLAVRWGTVIVGVALTFGTPHRARDAVAAAVILAYAGLRTKWPIRVNDDRIAALVAVLAELVIVLSVVLWTGYWQSPFLFCLLVAVVITGFGGGFTVALLVAVVAGTGVAIPAAARGVDGVLRLTTAGISELVLVALVAGYARRLFGEAEQRATQVLSRLSRLNEANTLLLQLNHVAQTLPASLELAETLSSTVGQVQAMLRPDCAAVLLWDASLGHWTLAAAEGLKRGRTFSDAELPQPVRKVVRAALRDRRAALVDLGQDGPGLRSSSRSGIYAPLVARDTLVGVIAAETQLPAGLNDRDLPLMSGVAEQAALAIDNAQWFGRLRTLGAEEERTRIARDLHDRVAQSLAYLAFELDRITTVSKRESVTTELETLRHDVRHVVTEVRDTLYDLRTDVSESEDLVAIMGAFLDRVGTRSHVQVRFEHHVAKRPPIPIEREFWRVAQEAITNVEHHAKARTLVVLWEAHASHVRLDIVDDGRGFPVGRTDRLDSYGLLGMRERADAIGATLDIESAPRQGTAVRCRLDLG